MGAALFQLTAVLRNVAGDEYVHHQLISSGAMRQITRLLSLFHNDIDVVSNLARIFRFTVDFIQISLKRSSVDIAKVGKKMQNA